MTHEELKQFLITLGVPPENASGMSDQLEKRSIQLAKKRNQTREEALTHLINLLRQGWAAKQKNISSPP